MQKKLLRMKIILATFLVMQVFAFGHFIFQTYILKKQFKVWILVLLSVPIVGTIIYLLDKKEV